MNGIEGMCVNKNQGGGTVFGEEAHGLAARVPGLVSPFLVPLVNPGQKRLQGEPRPTLQRCTSLLI